MAIMIYEAAEVEVIKAVLAEIERANKAHPRYPHDPVRRVAIIVEEVGETMQAALDMTRDRDRHHDLDNAPARLVEELTQTAAAAINMLLYIARESAARGREKILS